MIRINITKHAYDRMKERLGFSKKAAARMADVAYLEGISHRETKEDMTTLVTVWPIPQNLKNQVLGLQRKKKSEMMDTNQ